jgi:cation transport ATPase
MFKRVLRFFKDYKQLAFALVAAVIAGGLDLGGQDTAAHAILAFAAGAVSIPLLIDMGRTLRSGHFGIDILAITAIATSVILQEYWAAMIIVLMLTGGEALEDYAERRAKKELSNLLHNRPKITHLIKGNKTIDVKVSSVSTGDKLQILPGEVIPVDATILEGNTNVDESSITGESIPVSKQAGDELLSGAVNIDGVITVKAAHTAADSQYEQIIKLVKNATSGQSPFVRLADRYSVPFTLISFMVAGAAWYISGDSMRFLEVLVVATPCPLLLGAPIAFISGMSRASKHGVIIKTGSSLEQLAAVKTIAFDKTGTLTKGLPAVDQITTFDHIPKMMSWKRLQRLNKTRPIFWLKQFWTMPPKEK